MNYTSNNINTGEVNKLKTLLNKKKFRNYQNNSYINRFVINKRKNSFNSYNSYNSYEKSTQDESVYYSLKQKNRRIAKLEREIQRLRRLVKEKNIKLIEKESLINLKEDENKDLIRENEKMKRKEERRKRRIERDNNEEVEETFEGEVEENYDEEFNEYDEEYEEEYEEEYDDNVENTNFSVNIELNEDNDIDLDEDLDQNEDLEDDDIDPDEMTYEELLDLQERIGFVSRGFSKEEIKKIPQIKFSRKRAKLYSIDNRLCTICQYDYQKGESLNFFNCLHAFHTDCVENWLLKEKMCPNCKEEIEINE